MSDDRFKGNTSWNYDYTTDYLTTEVIVGHKALINTLSEYIRFYQDGRDEGNLDKDERLGFSKSQEENLTLALRTVKYRSDPRAKAFKGNKDYFSLEDWVIQSIPYGYRIYPSKLLKTCLVLIHEGDDLRLFYYVDESTRLVIERSTNN